MVNLTCLALIIAGLSCIIDAGASTVVSGPQSLRTSTSDEDTNNVNSNRQPSKIRVTAESVINDNTVPKQPAFDQDLVYIPVAIKSHSTRFVAECKMPTKLGSFRMRSYTYSSDAQKLEPIVMIYGDINSCDDVIVRVHDQCFTSEVFGSLRCDCSEQLEESLKLVRGESGVIIYLQQEGRGIGIANKIAAYSLQDSGVDTIDANLQLGFKEELREYMAVPDILADLNIKSIRLITNNPFKVKELTELGVKISDRIPMQIPSNKHSYKYLLTKRNRMSHLFNEALEVDRSAELRLNEDNSINFSDAVMASQDQSESTEAEEKALAARKSVLDVEPGHDITKGYAFGRHTVEAAIEAIREGKIVLVTDDEGRENEGDLIMAAEKSTAETIGFIVRYSSGVLCVSMESDRLEELMIPPMVVNNEDPKQTAYTVSVDYKHGITTGISSADRAAAFRGLADPLSSASDFQRPGHVFPLRYRSGGVIARGGHTEASLDLARMAGLQPAGVLAEVVNDDGSVMRLPGLQLMAVEHGLVLTSVQDIIAYRLETEGAI